ncbi:MAG: hypothetical protein GYB68_09850 [Chloroflexi bacterium]|nr:hypothetical protein [Chloroflexota bacterium]
MSRIDLASRRGQAVALIVAGVVFIIVGVSGLVLTGPSDEGQSGQVAQSADLTPTWDLPDQTATPPADARVERAVIAPATRTPLPIATATITPTAQPTRASTQSTEAEPSAPQASSTPSGPTNTPVPIVWTEAERNALSWLCHHEVSGMGAVTFDACLSVISTVRVRYAYPNSFSETDVLGTLTRPGQFYGTHYTDRPASAELYDMVVAYQNGARGSCNGFLFFNSVPGGPGDCVIYGVAGLFIQFANRSL